MGRGKLTPESAARQKKLIAESRAKNNAIKAEAMKMLEQKKLNAAVKAELNRRAKKTSGASRTPSSKPRRIAGGRGMGGGALGGGGLRSNVTK
jgi:anti-sigma factor RsiW